VFKINNLRVERLDFTQVLATPMGYNSISQHPINQ